MRYPLLFAVLIVSAISFPTAATLRAEEAKSGAGAAAPQDCVKIKGKADNGEALKPAELSDILACFDLSNRHGIVPPTESAVAPSLYGSSKYIGEMRVPDTFAPPTTNDWRRNGG